VALASGLYPDVASAADRVVVPHPAVAPLPETKN
jgi:hypothetical protein